MKPLTAIHSSKFPMLKTAVTRGAALFGMAGFVSTAMGDTVIDTILGWNGSASVSAFGLPNTATYGQTVTVPLSDPYLSSFTFEFNLPASNTFKGYVFAWDGTKAAGPSLYTSPTMSTAGTGFQAVTFNTGLFSLDRKSVV